MKRAKRTDSLKLAIAAVVTTFMLSACAAIPAPEGSAAARKKLTRLQANQELASRAPVAIKEAEVAVRAAEVPEQDKEVGRHLVYIADHKVDIAAARAQGRLYESQRAGLTKASESARLDSRTREADLAHKNTALAQADADSAREEAEAARLQNEELQRQLAELNARETDRGMVVTLGDVLFATGHWELNSGAIANLNKLSAFLNEYPDRVVAIEGHTDNVGTDSSNLRLSQGRADSVRSYLLNQGITSSRLTTVGLGEASPVAGNDTATGRQQNRRVEVIISNPNA